MKTNRSAYRTAFRLLSLLLLTGAFACSKPEEFDMDRSASPTESHHREFAPAGGFSRVVILYAEGHNTLFQYIKGDIEELCSGYIPQDPSDVLLVFSKLLLRDGRYSDPTSPVLFRVRRGADGTPVRDTLMTLPPFTPAASPETMSTVLTYVRNNFPAQHYGMVVSSHASGWMPAGYYYSPESFEGGSTVSWGRQRRRMPGSPIPFVDDFPRDDGSPMVRSYGRDQILTGGRSEVYEMTMREMAGAIPMHLDFLLFDACMMGCVEVAYELRNVADKISFSPAEVLAEGLDYSKLGASLFKNGEPDLMGICRDYFEHYDSQPDGDYRSATISLVDCTALEPLASLCKTLFAKYREQIFHLDPNVVQRYYRQGRYYFYDLQDILLRAGIDASEKAALQRALDACIVYKGATPSFIGAFDIKVYSGMSMYLPSIVNYYPKKDFTFLNDFYRTEIAWNEATGLVR